MKDIGQRKGFSKKDIIKLNNFYNCSLNSTRSTPFTFYPFIRNNHPQVKLTTISAGNTVSNLNTVSKCIFLLFLITYLLQTSEVITN